jgi:diguanylate cyclase (GGDEF)-like protein
MSKFLSHFLGYLERQDKAFFIFLGIALSVLIGVIDYVTLDYVVLQFYLIPVVIAVWFAGKRVGVLVALVSATAEIILDYIVSPNHSFLFVHYWNFFINFAFLVIILNLLAYLKGTLEVCERATYVEKMVNKQLHAEIEQRKRLEKDLLKNEEELRRLSVTDALTGLYNRRGLLAFAQQLIKVAKRNKQRIGLLYADLDNMKWINDHLGHREGDAALTELARILKESLRESDVIGRIGGDEFVALTIQPGEDFHQALTLRLQKSLEESNARPGRAYRLALSFGIVYYDVEKPRSIEEMLAEADKLMYAQKQAKKSS